MAKSREELLNDVWKDVVEKNKVATEGVMSEQEIEDSATDDSVEEEVEDVEELEEVQEISNESDVEDDDTDLSEESEEEDIDDDAEDVFDDWDEEDSDASSHSSEENVEEIDYSIVAKNLGLDNVKTIDDLKKHIESKGKESGLDDLPVELRQAVKLAKEGKDYKGLFQSEDKTIDHRMFDDETLVKHQAAELFINDDGSVDQDGLDEYVADLTGIQLKVEAKRIRKNLDEYYKNREAQRVADIDNKKAAADRELRSALKSINEIEGFKVTPNHKKDMYQDVSNGNAAKEMFYKEDGSLDMSKVAKIYFIYKNFPKIKSYLINKTRNDVKREDFENISNATKKGRQMSASQANTSKQEKADPLTGWVESLKAERGIQT